MSASEVLTAALEGPDICLSSFRTAPSALGDLPKAPQMRSVKAPTRSRTYGGRNPFVKPGRSGLIGRAPAKWHRRLGVAA